jgi:hypothetical protein
VLRTPIRVKLLLRTVHSFRHVRFPQGAPCCELFSQ